MGNKKTPETQDRWDSTTQELTSNKEKKIKTPNPGALEWKIWFRAEQHDHNAKGRADHSLVITSHHDRFIQSSKSTWIT